jgi:hypothetical protein
MEILRVAGYLQNLKEMKGVVPRNADKTVFDQSEAGIFNK